MKENANADINWNSNVGANKHKDMKTNTNKVVNVNRKQLQKSSFSFFALSFLFVIFLTSFFWSFKSEAANPYRTVAELPIQDGGRVKPFDTFAKEMLKLVHGKETFESRAAIPVVMTWILQPEAWADKKLIEIRFLKLKQTLKLNEQDKYFSLKEILGSENLNNIIQDLMNRRQAKEKLDPYGQAMQRLESQVFVFKEISSGHMIRLVPPKTAGDHAMGNDAWLDLNTMPQNLQPLFSDVIKSLIEVMDFERQKNENSSASVDIDGSVQKLDQAVQEFKKAARNENPSLYPEEKPISVEVHYNDFHPLQKAWIFYLLSALVGLVMWIFNSKTQNKKSFYLVWTLSGIAFLLHIYGMAIRVYLMGRPPVTNMYETVVWVGFGSILFAMIFEKIYKFRVILIAGSTVAALCLFLADIAPGVLDGSLNPLEPVLRSNFWLTIHVMTITISYAAFFLALMLGNFALPLFLKNTSTNIEKRKMMALSAYRCLQVGVGLLGPGIILGGVWADYSWGRFWGWDPKETWALIVFLGYLAMLHGRIVGWVKDFGLLAFSIITFNLVIMAWYGVNFVLGAGLHSYGFGAGGIEYVSIFVALEFIYVLVVFLKRPKN